MGAGVAVGNRKTTMMRAFLDVGDDNFVPIDQAASDPALRQAAIQQLRLEIEGLSPAEESVAKNTLQFLRNAQPRATGREQIFHAMRKFLAGAAVHGASLFAQVIQNFRLRSHDRRRPVPTFEKKTPPS
jgi:hypothetical protein